MQFLDPYIAHESTLDAWSETPNEKQNDESSSDTRRFKKRKPNNDSSQFENKTLLMTEKLLANNNINETAEREDSEKERRISNFMPLIKRSFRKLSEEDKEQCILQILCLAKNFK